MGSASEWVLEDVPRPADLRVAYGELPLQFGELRVPDGPGPHPLAIAIHGGFWKAKYDLTHLGHACEALRAQGIATFSLEYRRVGHAGGGFPGTLLDVERATQVLPQLAQHGVDTRRVVVFGHSAGGQLALWLAGELRRARGEASPIVGAVSLAGVTDLVRGEELNLGSGAVAAFMDGRPSEKRDAYAHASPIARLPIRVPQILLHGEADDTVPVAFSRDYASRARELGDAVRVETFPGAGHFEVVDPRSREWPRVVAAIHELLE